MDNFAQIHKHHATFYGASFQQYKRFLEAKDVTYCPQGSSTQQLPLILRYRACVMTFRTTPH